MRSKLPQVSGDYWTNFYDLYSAVMSLICMIYSARQISLAYNQVGLAAITVNTTDCMEASGTVIAFD